ncbi:hypothetical protein AgCh_016380 [Apium graveolens]
MMYQDPNVQYAPVQSRVTTNPVEQKITDSRMHMQQQYQDSGYLLPTQYYPQLHPQLQQPQFIHAGSQYVQHLPMGAVPMQAYYRVYSSQQPQHSHHPAVEQQYPVYYVPARQTQAYNMPVQQAHYSEVAGTAPETTAQLYNGTPNLGDYFPVLKKMDLQGILQRMTGNFGNILDGLVIEQLALERSGTLVKKNDALDELIKISLGSREEFEKTHIEHLLMEHFNPEEHT